MNNALTSSPWIHVWIANKQAMNGTAYYQWVLTLASNPVDAVRMSTSQHLEQSPQSILKSDHCCSILSAYWSTRLKNIKHPLINLFIQTKTKSNCSQNQRISSTIIFSVFQGARGTRIQQKCQLRALNKQQLPEIDWANWGLIADEDDGLSSWSNRQRVSGWWKEHIWLALMEATIRFKDAIETEKY